MSDQISQVILNKITTIISHAGNASSLSNDTPLISSGLLNSLKIVALASWIEETYGVDFSKIGFNSSYFENINSIMSLIEKHRNQ